MATSADHSANYSISCVTFWCCSRIAGQRICGDFVDKTWVLPMFYQLIPHKHPTPTICLQKTHKKSMKCLLINKLHTVSPLMINILSTSTINPLPVHSSLVVGKCLWPTKDQHFLHINSNMHIYTRVIKVVDLKSEVI